VSTAGKAYVWRCGVKDDGRVESALSACISTEASTAETYVLKYCSMITLLCHKDVLGAINSFKLASSGMPASGNLRLQGCQR